MAASVTSPTPCLFKASRASLHAAVVQGPGIAVWSSASEAPRNPSKLRGCIQHLPQRLRRRGGHELQMGNVQAACALNGGMFQPWGLCPPPIS